MEILKSLVKKSCGWSYQDLTVAAYEAGGPEALLQSVFNDGVNVRIKEEKSIGIRNGLILGVGIGLVTMFAWMKFDEYNKKRLEDRRKEAFKDSLVQHYPHDVVEVSEFDAEKTSELLTEYAKAQEEIATDVDMRCTRDNEMEGDSEDAIEIFKESEI